MMRGYGIALMAASVVAMVIFLSMPGPTDAADTMASTHPAPAADVVAHGTRTVAGLGDTSGEPDQVVIVLGYDKPGDGGGGTFYWDPAVPEAEFDGGTVVGAEGGGWRRVFAGGFHAEWFGVRGITAEEQESFVISDERTRRMQAALDAARGNVLYLGPGIHLLTQTLIIPQNTRVEGAAPMDVWSDVEGGTTLLTVGNGTPRAWQDTGDSALDTFTALLVFGGNNVHLSHLGIKTSADSGAGVTGWGVGVLLPSVKRCSLSHVAIDGHWQTAALLLDATWSPSNQRMIELHEGRIQPSHMNEFDMYGCMLSGNTGLMIRGAVGRDPMDYTPEEWIWSWGGTSDINVIACRLEGRSDKALDQVQGAAYYSDAPMRNAALSGQGHRLIACNLRARTRYMVYLGHSNRDRFSDCYFESLRKGDEKTLMYRQPPNPGMTTFMGCRFNGLDFETHWDGEGVMMWGSGSGATF